MSNSLSYSDNDDTNDEIYAGYTEDQQLVLEMFRLGTTGEVQFMSVTATENDTGEEVVLLGVLVADDDGEVFVPLAKFFDANSKPMMNYTISHDDMVFDDDVDCDCDACTGVSTESEEVFEEKNKGGGEESCCNGEVCSVECGCAEDEVDLQIDFGGPETDSQKSFTGRLTSWFRRVMLRS